MNNQSDVFLKMTSKEEQIIDDATIDNEINYQIVKQEHQMIKDENLLTDENSTEILYDNIKDEKTKGISHLDIF